MQAPFLIAGNKELRLINPALGSFVSPYQRASDVGVEMIRTVWLAAFGLACIGGLYAGKVTASISPPDGDVADPAMIRAGIVPDTLTAADKIDLTGLRPTAEAALAPPTAPIVIRPVKTRTTIPSRDLRRRANTKAKVTAAIPKSRTTFRMSRNEKASKLAGDQTKCAGINSLGALIMSLTATSHCS
jgi:hypothetical protein